MRVEGSRVRLCISVTCISLSHRERWLSRAPSITRAQRLRWQGVLSYHTSTIAFPRGTPLFALKKTPQPNRPISRSDHHLPISTIFDPWRIRLRPRSSSKEPHQHSDTPQPSARAGSTLGNPVLLSLFLAKHIIKRAIQTSRPLPLTPTAATVPFTDTTTAVPPKEPLPAQAESTRAAAQRSVRPDIAAHQSSAKSGHKQQQQQQQRTPEQCSVRTSRDRDKC